MKKTYRISLVRTVLFALIAGAYTGIVMSLPFLKGTSFQDIGIQYEWWVIFALLVVAGCRNGVEAACKCFLFFLLSQPTVYVTEWLLGTISLSQGWYYYKMSWLVLTLLTLPGGFFAFFAKKQNLFGALILSLSCALEAGFGYLYLRAALADFPYHLLSALFGFTMAAALPFLLQGKRRERCIALVLGFLLAAVTLLAAMRLGLSVTL